MSGTPPPSDEKTARADLSHLARKTTAEDDGPTFKSRAANIGSPLESLTKFIDGLKNRTKAKSEAGGNGNGQDIAHILRKNRKIIFLVVLVVLVVPMLIIVGINIPTQIARSEAFGLYQNKQYEEALESFNQYLRDNPEDSEAVFYAAQAAMAVGDIDYAGALTHKIAAVPAMASNPDFLFIRALALVPAETALTPLNKLITVQPEHVGGRLLRGILLTRQNAVRRARDDFIQADSLIRGNPDFDNSNLLAVHSRVMKNPQAFLPMFDLPPPAIAADAAVVQTLSRRLNVPVVVDTFINRYIPVLPADPEAAGLSSNHLASLYYTLLLLQAEEFNEARVEISKLPAAALAESSTGNVAGLLAALTGDTAAATEKFAALARLPAPALLFNQANYLFGAAPTPENAAGAAALLDQVLESAPEFMAARHNRALLRLLIGDFAGAAKDVAAIPAELPPTPMLRVLSALAENPRQENISQLLASVDEQQFPGKQYAAIAHHLALGDYEAATALLQKQPVGEALLADELYARILADNGLFLRALGVLKAIKNYSTSNHETLARNRYQSGIIALVINDLPQAEAALAFIEENGGGESAYSHALRGHIFYRQDKPQAALTAIKQSLIAASTEALKRQIATRAANILFDTEPEVLRSVLHQDDSLTPREAAVLARLLAPAGDPQALQLARAASARYPIFDVLHHASLALLAASNNEEALNLMLAASTARPADVPTLTRIVKLQTDAGDGEGAQKTQHAIDNIKFVTANPSSQKNTETYSVIVPQDNKVINNVALALNNNFSPAPALKGFDRLLEDAPGLPEKALLNLQRGSFLIALKRYPAAEQHLRKSLAGGLSAEQETQASFYLAKIMMLNKNYAAATELYRNLVATHPDSSLYRRLTGYALAQHPQIEYLDEAIVYLEKAVRLFPADIELYFELANIYRRKHDADQATAVLRQAARVAPLYPPIYKLLYNTQKANNSRNARENSAVFSALSSIEREQ